MQERDVYQYSQPIGPAEATPNDITRLYQEQATRDVQFRTAASFVMEQWAQQPQDRLTHQRTHNRLYHLLQTMQDVRANYDATHIHAA